MRYSVTSSLGGSSNGGSRAMSSVYARGASVVSFGADVSAVVESCESLHPASASTARRGTIHRIVLECCDSG
jgi:hypothetical protein